MAKKRASKAAAADTTEEKALHSEAEAGKLAGTESVNTSSRGNGNMEITFKHKSTQKNGINTYSADGYGGSIYLNKSLFAGQPPAEITVSAPEGAFVAAGAGRVSTKAMSPERIARAEEKLKKQQERQAKQAENLRKQQELVERLKAAQGQGQPAAEA